MSSRQSSASLIAALLLMVAGIYTLREFLPALAWTVIFAIALWPSFQRMARRWPRHKRALLPGLYVLAVVLVFVIPVIFIAVPLASEAHEAANYWVQIQHNGIAPPEVLGKLPHGQKLMDIWQRELGHPKQISALTTGAIHGGGGKMAGVVARATIHRLMLFGFTLLGLFFILRNADDVVEQLKAGSLRAFGEAGEDIGLHIIYSVHGTVSGLVLVGLGEGVLLGGAYIVAGAPHPLLFGLLTAILAMVPFGAVAAIGVVAVILGANGSAMAAAAVVIFGSVVIFVADHFIRPALIGGATRLPFYWVLLGILGGISAWGLAGLFIGPALMAALNLLWREWIGSQKGPINPAPEEMEAAASVGESEKRRA